MLNVSKDFFSLFLARNMYFYNSAYFTCTSFFLNETSFSFGRTKPLVFFPKIISDDVRYISDDVRDGTCVAKSDHV